MSSPGPELGEAGEALASGANVKEAPKNSVSKTNHILLCYFLKIKMNAKKKKNVSRTNHMLLCFFKKKKIKVNAKRKRHDEGKIKL